jgi:hypothetical protein
MSGDYGAIAAIVSSAAEYADLRSGTAAQFIFNQFGTTDTGIFHQNNAGEPERIYRPFVKRPNLVPCHNKTLFIR